MVETINATTGPLHMSQTSPLYLGKAFKGSNAEISISSVYMTSSSMLHVEFIWPSFHSQLEVYTRSGVEISWGRYLQPFASDIWYTVLAWIFLCCFTIASANSIAAYYDGQQDRSRTSELHQLWSPLFAFLAQGTTEPTAKAWERLLLVAAFLAPAVLIPAYNAALTSFLAFDTPAMPFTTLEGMKEFPKHRLSGVKDLKLDELLEKANDETSKYLLNYAMLPMEERPRTSQEGFHRMCHERLSFIETRFSAAALKPACSHYKLPRPIISIPLSMTMPINSPYANTFNIIMRNIRFSGILQTVKYSITKHQIIAMFLEEKEDVELPPIDFEDIVLLLTTLLFTMGISLVILFLEIIVYMRFNQPSPSIPFSH